MPTCSTRLLLCGLLLGTSVIAEAPVSWADAGALAPSFNLVFESGEANYVRIRTPQILVTQKGAILVIAQGRDGAHDQAGNDILLKRSTDGGRTWSPLKVIVDGHAPFPGEEETSPASWTATSGRNSINSLCVVQLRESGRILIVGCWMPRGYQSREFQYLSPSLQAYQKAQGVDKAPTIVPGYTGRDVARSYVIHSDDDGQSWSPMSDITAMAKRPPPALTCVPGPGAAIELMQGSHAGRIVVPCNVRWLETSSETPHYRCQPYAVYSDDGGNTWIRGELAPTNVNGLPLDANECQVVELAGGQVLLNVRGGGRFVATSRDGGHSWSPLKRDRALIGPDTAAGLLRYGGLLDGEKSRILFSYPSATDRENGTIYLSYDEGTTWTVSKLLRPGRFSYSCLARLPNGDVACVFDGSPEPGEFGTARGHCVLMASFPMAWLSADNGVESPGS